MILFSVIAFSFSAPVAEDKEDIDDLNWDSEIDDTPINEISTEKVHYVVPETHIQKIPRRGASKEPEKSVKTQGNQVLESDSEKLLTSTSSGTTESHVSVADDDDLTTKRLTTPSSINEVTTEEVLQETTTELVEPGEKTELTTVLPNLELNEVPTTTTESLTGSTESDNLLETTTPEPELIETTTIDVEETTTNEPSSN